MQRAALSLPYGLCPAGRAASPLAAAARSRYNRTSAQK